MVNRNEECCMKEGNLYELTLPQKRIWLTQMLHPDSVMFNIGGYVLIKGSVDVHRLKRAIISFMDNNVIFHIRITGDGDKYYQYYNRMKNYTENEISYVDLSKSCSSQEDLDVWVQKQGEIPFVLENNLLYKFIVFRLNDNAYGYFIKLHHVIADGWTFQLLTDCIGREYENPTSENVKNQDICSTYERYMNDEKRYLTSAQYHKNKSFWMEKMSNLSLSSDKSSSKTTAKRKTFTLDNSIREELYGYCKCNKISMNAVLLTAYLIYLRKSTQKKDIIIGVPFWGRNSKKDFKSLGMYVSSVPFRFIIDDDETIKEMAVRVRIELMACFFNHRYPYNIMVKDLGLTGAQGEKLYDNCFNYYNLKLLDKIDGFQVASREFFNGEQNYSLQVIIRDWNESSSLGIDIDYKVSDFKDSEIDSMGKQLVSVIKKVITDNELSIQQVSLLTDNEYEELVNQFNNTETYTIDKTVVDLFNKQVKTAHDKVALEDGDECLTYEQLNEKINQLAGCLREKGIGRNSKVGIVTEHSMETIIAIMGILKLGGIFIPIDSNYPESRIKYIIEDTAMDLILTNLNDFELQECSVDVMYLDYKNMFWNKDYCNMDSMCSIDDLAYILYTSGTTGKPKGVMVEHRGLANYIIWADKMYVDGAEGAFPLFTSLSFDLTMTSVFTPLISGNKIVIYRDDEDEYVLHRIMNENKVQVIKLTPTHMSLLTDKIYKNSSIKRMIVGGEQLTTNLAKRITLNLERDVEIYNEYGPSEATVGCMIYKYDMNSDKGHVVPIGSPAANTRIYILDNDLNPVPINSIGELYISGKGLAAGYINRSELTAQKFVDNPLENGEKMYATGDHARFIRDGCIEYVGRKDMQIKIHGHRIELDEIKNVLLENDAVKEAIVISRKDNNGMEGLCCYYVKRSFVTVEDLRQNLAVKLPNYMIPNWFIEIDEIPLTTNGKIDVNSLLQVPVRNERTTDGIESHSESVDILLDVMRNILKREELSPIDNFYEIGGDSVQAIRISSKMLEEGYRLKASDILSGSTINDVAKNMKAIGSRELSQVDGEVQFTPILSQFFNMNHKDNNYYNQSVVLKMNKEISTQQLEKAFSYLVKFHDSLRLNYDKNSGKLIYNDAHDNHVFQVIQYDLSEYTEEQQKEMIIDKGIELKSGFDIEKDLLIRACCFHISKQDNILLVTAHHIVIDGISWSILLEDFEKVLKQIRDGNRMELSYKSASFKDWSTYLIGERTDNELIDEYIENTEKHENQIKLYDCNITYKNSIKRELILTKDRTSQLLNLVNENNMISELDMVMTAVTMALNKIISSDCLVADMEWHGRNESDEIDVSRTIGWFTAISTIIIENLTENIESTMKNIKDGIKKAKEYSKNNTFVSWYCQNRINKKAVLKMNYLGNYSSVLDKELFGYADYKTGEDISEDNYMENPIEVNAIIVDSKLKISLCCSLNILSEMQINEFCNHITTCLDELIQVVKDNKDINFLLSDFDTVELTEEDMENLFY
ncbi:non-ribosomal peptide synthetase [Vallitalea guaymasensis]|uniref:non-ribosomal peptide synthetase n=1 Tax=Vallitalea guaymasensis TaxID=1185412 RepID=UPI00272B4E79|nr:amino acid adenylation domain-containing protein [Vallitalea guaymasensis]